VKGGGRKLLAENLIFLKRKACNEDPFTRPRICTGGGNEGESGIKKEPRGEKRSATIPRRAPATSVQKKSSGVCPQKPWGSVSSIEDLRWGKGRCLKRENPKKLGAQIRKRQRNHKLGRYWTGDARHSVNTGVKQHKKKTKGGGGAGKLTPTEQKVF